MKKRINFYFYYKSKINKYFFRWIDWKKIKTIKQQLSNLDVKKDIILDLGSGSGQIASKLNKNIICIDINKKLLEECRKKNLKTLRHSLDEPLPFENNTISAVLMIDTIEHIQSPNKLIKEIKRSLKPKGKLIIFTPPYDSIRWLLAEKLHHLLIKKESDHITPFTEESLTFLLKNNFENFTIQRINFNLTLCAIVNPT